jgi:predicted nuclease of predicted toxin-antitoxin system
MNPLDFALLADENISLELVAALRERGIDICTIGELGLVGGSDAAVLARAKSENRVVLTHDGDFGLLAIRQEAPLLGVVFLRPGHVKTAFNLEAIDTLRSAAVDVEPPFLLVLEHRQNRIVIRLRREP